MCIYIYIYIYIHIYIYIYICRYVLLSVDHLLSSRPKHSGKDARQRAHRHRLNERVPIVIVISIIIIISSSSSNIIITMTIYITSFMGVCGTGGAAATCSSGRCKPAACILLGLTGANMICGVS